MRGDCHRLRCSASASVGAAAKHSKEIAAAGWAEASQISEIYRPNGLRYVALRISYFLSFCLFLQDQALIISCAFEPIYSAMK